jgi:Flp pilus assembly protein TadG
MFASVSRKLACRFRRDSRGSVTTLFAFALLPVLAGIGAAVDYGEANSLRTAMQAAADSTSLATVKAAASLNSSDLQKTVSDRFVATLHKKSATPAVTGTYDANSGILSVGASMKYTTSLVRLIGIDEMTLTVNSAAKIAAKTWQICVMVTSPDENHVLLVKDQSTIDFDNCMVQVNTKNWDAVEARDTSYIHSTNGENCFVGDIHYGDVKPPKNPTCTFFPDPFASWTVPTQTCTHTNLAVGTATTLSPGTYCGGININANVTLSPGVYYIQDGDLKMEGSASMVAKGVTFLISGSKSNIVINTTGTIEHTPSTSAGQFSGFLFYYDPPSSKNNKITKGGKNTFSKMKYTGNGVIYLGNQTIELDHGAEMTIKPGSIIADQILPDGGSKLTLTGQVGSSSGALNSLMKAGTTQGTVALVK